MKKTPNLLPALLLLLLATTWATAQVTLEPTKRELRRWERSIDATERSLEEMRRDGYEILPDPLETPLYLARERGTEAQRITSWQTTLQRTEELHAELVQRWRYPVWLEIYDSGVDGTHPELAPAWRGQDNYTPEANTPGQHGTHVAGCALQFLSAGIEARKLWLHSSKILLAAGNGQFAWSEQAVRTNVPLASRHTAGDTTHIANMSFGGGTTLLPGFEDALRLYTEAGALVTAANGNNAGPVSYPGKSPYVWGVASLDENLTISSYSNFGPETDASFGGRNIVSTLPGGGKGPASGTSMAAPGWAAMVAIMRGVYGRALLPDMPAIQRYYTRIATRVGNGDAQRYGPGYAYIRAILDTQPEPPGGGGGPNPPPPPPPPPPSDAVQSYVIETGGLSFRYKRDGEPTWSTLKIHQLHLTCTLPASTPQSGYDRVLAEVQAYYTNWSTVLTPEMDWRDATYWAGQFLEYVARTNKVPIQVSKVLGTDEAGRVHVVQVFDRAEADGLWLHSAQGIEAIVTDGIVTRRE